MGHREHCVFIGSGKRKLSELDQIAVWTKLCTNRQLEDVYGQELRCRLAVWLSEQEKNKELNAFLRTLSKGQIAEKDRLCMARLMILHGFYDKAYEWLAGQCFCKLEPAELMRLCSRLLAKESHLEEKRLMLLCAQAALNGKYDDRIYSIWRMLTREAAASWKCFCRRQKFRNRHLENQQEAAGSAIVYRAGCDGADGALRDYISAGGSPELEEAFLYRCAYANVILKQPIHRYMVQMILRLCRWGARVSRLCKIAALQYYAKNKGMLEEKTAVRWLKLSGSYLKKTACFRCCSSLQTLCRRFGRFWTKPLSYMRENPKTAGFELSESGRGTGGSTVS